MTKKWSVAIKEVTFLRQDDPLKQKQDGSISGLRSWEFCTLCQIFATFSNFRNLTWRLFAPHTNTSGFKKSQIFWEPARKCARGKQRGTSQNTLGNLVTNFNVPKTKNRLFAATRFSEPHSGTRRAARATRPGAEAPKPTETSSRVHQATTSPGLLGVAAPRTRVRAPTSPADRFLNG